MNEEKNKAPLYIIKIGGNVIDDPQALDKFLNDFSSIKEKKLLVHGGGKRATSIGNKLGIVSKYTDGRRITDGDTIDLVTMVYGGLVNKKLTALLQSKKVDAFGITGADGNLIPAVKRPVKTIDYGWVGDVEAKNIDTGKWSIFLNNGLVPVVAPLTHDGQGNMLNTNADTIAAVLAIGLASMYEVSLLYCFEKNGVLKEVNDEDSLIHQLSQNLYSDLRQKELLFAGILPKIDNAFEAVNKGVSRVVIGNSAELTSLINGEKGTQIIKQ